MWLRILSFLVGFGYFMIFLSRKWFICVLGSLYVFFCLIGFCVVIMRNGLGRWWILLLIVV